MSNSTNPRLYVGNLLYSAQREDILNLFAENGIGIKDLSMSIDAFTGRNPSYCFVDMHTERDAVLALQTMQGQLVRGRPIKLNRNTQRQPPSQKPQSATEKRLSTIRYSDDVSSHWTAPTLENRRLYVGGLSQLANHHVLIAEMAALFADYDIEAVSKLIWPHSSRQHDPGSHFYAFVDLATAEQAANAAHVLNGRHTPHSGAYLINRCSQRSKGSARVLREQLGGSSSARRIEGLEVVRRDYSKNWRREE